MHVKKFNYSLYILFYVIIAGHNFTILLYFLLTFRINSNPILIELLLINVLNIWRSWCLRFWNQDFRKPEIFRLLCMAVVNV